MPERGARGRFTIKNFKRYIAEGFNGLNRFRNITDFISFINNVSARNLRIELGFLKSKFNTLKVPMKGGTGDILPKLIKWINENADQINSLFNPNAEYDNINQITNLSDHLESFEKQREALPEPIEEKKEEKEEKEVKEEKKKRKDPSVADRIITEAMRLKDLPSALTPFFTAFMKGVSTDPGTIVAPTGEQMGNFLSTVISEGGIGILESISPWSLLTSRIPEIYNLTRSAIHSLSKLVRHGISRDYSGFDTLKGFPERARHEIITTPRIDGGDFEPVHIDIRHPVFRGGIRQPEHKDFDFKEIGGDVAFRGGERIPEEEDEDDKLFEPYEPEEKLGDGEEEDEDDKLFEPYEPEEKLGDGEEDDEDNDDIDTITKALESLKSKGTTTITPNQLNDMIEDIPLLPPNRAIGDDLDVMARTRGLRTRARRRLRAQMNNILAGLVLSGGVYSIYDIIRRIRPTGGTTGTTDEPTEPKDKTDDPPIFVKSKDVPEIFKPTPFQPSEVEIASAQSVDNPIEQHLMGTQPWDKYLTKAFIERDIDVWLNFNAPHLEKNNPFVRMNARQQMLKGSGKSLLGVDKEEKVNRRDGDLLFGKLDFIEIGIMNNIKPYLGLNKEMMVGDPDEMFNTRDLGYKDVSISKKSDYKDGLKEIY